MSYMSRRHVLHLVEKNKKDCVSRASQVPVQVAKATSTSVSKNDKKN
jgi:hypothetical protein